MKVKIQNKKKLVFAEVENSVKDYCKLTGNTYTCQDSHFIVSRNEKEFLVVMFVSIVDRYRLSTSSLILRANNLERKKLCEEISEDTQFLKYIEEAGLEFLYEDGEMYLLLSIDLPDDVALIKTHTILQISSILNESKDYKNYIAEQYSRNEKP